MYVWSKKQYILRNNFDHLLNPNGNDAVDCGTALEAVKVWRLFPDGVIGVFQWHNPSGRTMDQGSTHFLTEMSTRNISWGVKTDAA
jgi:hypothetical protein